jgi:hypothetical protein
MVATIVVLLLALGGRHRQDAVDNRHYKADEAVHRIHRLIVRSSP